MDKKLYKNHKLPSLSTIFTKFDANNIYSYMNGMYLSNDTPGFIKIHRNYFKDGNKGFGEDPFHILWLKIFQEYKPKDLLEIGVYRGQVLTLWALISRELVIDSNIYGLSPLTNANDSNSNYVNIDYESDIKKNCKNFNLKFPQIIKEYSNSKNGKDFIKSKKWDLIYIDGSHDYQVVKEDFLNSFNSLKPNGIIVMDDSSLYLNYDPRINSFGGHPGPSRICSEIAMLKMKHLGTVGHNNIFQKI